MNKLQLLQRRWLLCLLCGWLVAIAGCNTSSPPTTAAGSTFSGSYPIKATVTVGMVADLVREIGGEQVKVTQLMGSAVDPHLHKPSRDDVQSIASSDAVFCNGLMLEGKMAEALESSAQVRPTCVVGKNLQLPQDIVGADPHHPDPHVWMDVSLWSQASKVIGTFMAALDPSHAPDYVARCDALSSKLDKLHAYGQRIIATIPAERRVLITSHDAFRYFGKAYGLEVQAIQGISTESEAGLQRINELVDLLVSRKIEAVFIESSVPKKSIEALIEGAHSRGQKVRIGGELFSDAMGPEGTYEGTYIGMMDHNLSTIARALGARDVPAEGFRAEQ